MYLYNPNLIISRMWTIFNASCSIFWAQQQQSQKLKNERFFFFSQSYTSIYSIHPIQFFVVDEAAAAAVVDVIVVAVMSILVDFVNACDECVRWLNMSKPCQPKQHTHALIMHRTNEPSNDTLPWGCHSTISTKTGRKWNREIVTENWVEDDYEITVHIEIHFKMGKIEWGTF